jgi:hypothetical protein
MNYTLSLKQVNLQHKLKVNRPSKVISVVNLKIKRIINIFLFVKIILLKKSSQFQNLKTFMTSTQIYLIHHLVIYIDPSFGNKIQSDEGKQEDFQTWIDQTYNESKCSFSVQNFDNSLQSKFLEYKETKFDYDSPIFYDNVSFQELDLRFDISCMELIQPEITNLFEHMPMLEKDRARSTNKFSSLHGGTITGRQPIIIHNDRK